MSNESLVQRTKDSPAPPATLETLSIQHDGDAHAGLSCPPRLPCVPRASHLVVCGVALVDGDDVVLHVRRLQHAVVELCGHTAAGRLSEWAALVPLAVCFCCMQSSELRTCRRCCYCCTLLAAAHAAAAVARCLPLPLLPLLLTSTHPLLLPPPPPPPEPPAAAHQTHRSPPHRAPAAPVYKGLSRCAPAPAPPLL